MSNVATRLLSLILLLQSRPNWKAAELAEVFGRWNQGLLDSYLIEITRDILGYRDENGDPLLEKILDTAGQKGTGKWTAIAALDVGTTKICALVGEPREEGMDVVGIGPGWRVPGHEDPRLRDAVLEDLPLDTRAFRDPGANRPTGRSPADPSAW